MRYYIQTAAVALVAIALQLSCSKADKPLTEADATKILTGTFPAGRAGVIFRPGSWACGMNNAFFSGTAYNVGTEVITFTPKGRTQFSYGIKFPDASVWL